MKYKKLILTLLIIALIGLSGCENTYQTCHRVCRNVNRNNFQYQKEFDSREFIEFFNRSSTPRYKNYTINDNTALDEHCLNQCKP